MAVQMLQSPQPFTLTFRGYDKAEVDKYVESLWDVQAETSSALEESEATIGSLEAEVQARVQRVTELESCVREESPRTIAALGERVTLILEQAEDAAAETVVAAQQEADAIHQNAALAAERVTQHAASHASELETSAAAMVRFAAEQARQLEDDARRSATQILDDAESQAQSRISDITQWVSRVRAQIKAEQIQAAEEFHAAREQRQTELRHIAARRDGVLDSLRTVCESVTETIGAHRSPDHSLAINGDSSAIGSGPDGSPFYDHDETTPSSSERTTMTPSTQATEESGDAKTITEPEDTDPDGTASVGDHPGD
ncbi:MAG: hypothetical protein M3137_09525 [Actinomycetota bacterium]|nr:hypothetical protein [Actinomycetota bacterium]